MVILLHLHMGISVTKKTSDRIHVLTHILLNAVGDTRTRSRKRSHPPSVADLELSTWRHVKEMQNPNAPEILEEMFKVRQLMERLGIGDCAETILSGLGI